MAVLHSFDNCPCKSPNVFFFFLLVILSPLKRYFISSQMTISIFGGFNFKIEESG